MNKQRIYDAMLIKAFRADIRMTELDKWLAVYDIQLKDSDLRRIPKTIGWVERVRVVVARNMKPLADRLWDTEKSKDIETLDWMVNLDCSNKYDKILAERATMKKHSNRNRRKGGILATAREAHLKSYQWNVNK